MWVAKAIPLDVLVRGDFYGAYQLISIVQTNSDPTTPYTMDVQTTTINKA